MRGEDLARLVALAAIWGGSFAFMRVTSPVLGPVWTTEGRILIGGLVLAGWFAWTGFDPQWRRHWRLYALVGLLNAALPYTLYAYAALHIPASMSAILNCTAPIFGLVLGALFAVEKVTARKIGGLALGAVGVALLAQPGSAEPGAAFGWGIAAGLGATFCYGLTGVIMRRWGAGVPSRGTAVGAQLLGAAMLVPLLPLVPPSAAPSPLVVANLLGLAVLASGIALLLYFRLISDIGVTRALTVTFLIPLFGILWGALFLGESLGLGVLGGAGLIVAGTALVLRG